MFKRTRKNHTKRKRKPTRKPNGLPEIAWQFIGALTLIVLFAVIVFGREYEATQSAEKSIFEQGYADVMLKLDSNY